MVEENVSGKTVINQPAGHLEEGESLVEAVIRETFEETGWTLEPESLVSINLWRKPDNAETFLRFSFTGACRDFDSKHILDDDIIRTHWLSFEEIKDQENRLRSPMVLDNIEDYLSGTRYPLELLKLIV